MIKMSYVDRSAGEADGSFDITEWMTKGLSWESYLSECDRNVERMKSMYEMVTIPKETIDFFKERGPFIILCIAEDWCPDCVQNVPLVVKLTESLPGTELKLFFRDKNEDLMNHYLANGKRVIPTVVLFDRDYNELGRWAGPSRKAKAWTIDTLVKGRKIADIPQEEKEKFGDLYDQRFLKEFLSDSLVELRASVK